MLGPSRIPLEMRDFFHRNMHEGYKERALSVFTTVLGLKKGQALAIVQQLPSRMWQHYGNYLGQVSSSPGCL